MAKILSSLMAELLKSKIGSRDQLLAVNRKLAKKHRAGLALNSEILKAYRLMLVQGKIKPRPELEKILRKRAVRTLSGIAPVAVLVKPFACPGRCAYCPTEKNVPQSYLANEPAVMRAIRCDYDPFKQVQMRLKALEANGHEPSKIELIVIGGTWSVLPEKYKYWFVKECFRAANEYGKSQKSKVKSQNLKRELSFEQKRNETAKYRLIGVTLETRPDYIKEKELWQMRELGATRVELGVQAVDDKILKLNKRGHGVAEIARAGELLKNFGFKITYHFMPGLPGSSAKKDLSMFKKLFTDQRFQPDQLKFYPTVVTRGSLLFNWWRAGKYRPYSDKVLKNLIIKCKAVVPPYVRIVRLIRDIPGESIVAGNLITNLRQVLKQEGVKCNCIRCREAGGRKFKVKSLKLEVKKYKASGGEEYFLSYESKDGKTLYGFCRLRLNVISTPSASEGEKSLKVESGKSKGFLPSVEMTKIALIRELHVYGELVPIGKNKIIQHAGLGKKLMAEAEKIARAAGSKKMAVIAGVGARDYYRKLGYGLEDTYMVKNLI